MPFSALGYLSRDLRAHFGVNGTFLTLITRRHPMPGFWMAARQLRRPLKKICWYYEEISDM